jgi:hypothetical protein
MKQADIYLDLKGRELSLTELSAAEVSFIAEMKTAAKKAADWSAFSNLWMARIAEMYADQNLTRPQIRKTVAYQICQDLDSRLAVSKGMARQPDYRDELAALIEQRFQTRRAFCEATGLSEDMLSHVLAGRKHLAINTLEESLHRIGFSLHIVPSIH